MPRNPMPQHGQSSVSSLAQLAPAWFAKANPNQCCIIKTTATTARVQGVSIVVGNVMLHIEDSPIAMPAPLILGTDYYVYVCMDGYLVASANPVAPEDYVAAECRVLGGFHYGAIPEGTTVASGQFASSGTGMIWTQADVNQLIGINAWSCWDLNWRPRSNPKGMALVPEISAWVDIYLCSTDPDAGTSRHNVTAASGAYLPKIPLSRGGNGSASYTRLGWWEAAEIAASQRKRLLHEWEFNQAAYGVTEETSMSTAPQQLTTAFTPSFVSKYGLQQAAGCHWVWGADHGQRDMGAAASAWGWQAQTAGRGSLYIETATSDVRVLLGGARGGGSISGSRCTYWVNSPWSSFWSIGLRAASDHLLLV